MEEAQEVTKRCEQIANVYYNFSVLVIFWKER